MNDIYDKPPSAGYSPTGRIAYVYSSKHRRTVLCQEYSSAFAGKPIIWCMVGGESERPAGAMNTSELVEEVTILRAQIKWLQATRNSTSPPPMFNELSSLREDIDFIKMQLERARVCNFIKVVPYGQFCDQKKPISLEALEQRINALEGEVARHG